MDGRMMRAIVAALLIIVGGVWIFQGVGVLGGSPMTGITFWAWAGAAALVIGAVMVAGLLRRR